MYVLLPTDVVVRCVPAGESIATAESVSLAPTVKLARIVVDSPTLMLAESAVMVAVGGCATVRVFESEPTPHVTVYVVLDVGETVTVPDVAPPVEKLVPVQDDAYCDDHVKLVEPPFAIVEAPSVSDAVC